MSCKDLTYWVELLRIDIFLLNKLAFFLGLAIDFAIVVKERHISIDQNLITWEQVYLLILIKITIDSVIQQQKLRIKPILSSLKSREHATGETERKTRRTGELLQ